MDKKMEQQKKLKCLKNVVLGTTGAIGVLVVGYVIGKNNGKIANALEMSRGLDKMFKSNPELKEIYCNTFIDLLNKNEITEGTTIYKF